MSALSPETLALLDRAAGLSPEQWWRLVHADAAHHRARRLDVAIAECEVDGALTELEIATIAEVTEVAPSSLRPRIPGAALALDNATRAVQAAGRISAEDRELLLVPWTTVVGRNTKRRSA